eukprot:g1093.t1
MMPMPMPMPGMKNHSACEATMMEMYFHGGFHDDILFENWHACNAGQYLCILFAIFIIATFASVLRAFTANAHERCAAMCRGKRVISKTGREEALLKAGACGDETPCTMSLTVVGLTCSSCAQTVEAALLALPGVEGVIVAPDLENVLLKAKCSNGFFGAVEEAVADVGFSLRGIQCGENPQRTVGGKSLGGLNASSFSVVAGKFLLMSARYGLDYALMLAAMSFNVGVFFAVVCGLAFGSSISLFFSPAPQIEGRVGAADDCCA